MGEDALQALAREVRSLRDKAEVEDCIRRYCRGADRLDAELLLSAYHPDAVDDRGEAFTGTPAQFVAWLFPMLRTLGGSSHTVCDTRSEIEGDVAHAESYVIFAVWSHAREDAEGFASMGTARYLDRLERRGGVWGIAHRQCLMDMTFRVPIGSALVGALVGVRDKSDARYARPLEPTPEALARFAARQAAS
jgi:hypothetical protein